MTNKIEKKLNNKFIFNKINSNKFGKIIKKNLDIYNKKCLLNKLFSQPVIKKEYLLTNIIAPDELKFIIYEYIGSEILANYKFVCTSFINLINSFAHKYFIVQEKVLFNGKRISSYFDKDYLTFLNDFKQLDYVLDHECSNCCNKYLMQPLHLISFRSSTKYYSQTSFISNDNMYFLTVRTFIIDSKFDNDVTTYYIVDINKN